MWQDGHFDPLTKETVSRLQVKKVKSLIKPASPSVLRARALKQLHLAHHQIHILDDYWIASLDDKHRKPLNRYVSINQICISSHQQEEILSLINDQTPPVDCFILDEFSPRAFKLFKRLKYQFPLIHIVENNLVAMMDVHGRIDDDPLLCFPSEMLGQLHCLNVLNRNGLMNARDLHAFLSKTLKLNTLMFPDLTIEGELDRIPELKTLETLHIERSNISGKNLKSLLESAPRLKKLTITGGYNLSDFDFTDGFLADLEQLTISDSNIPVFELQRILKSATKLEKLELIRIDNFLDLDTTNCSFPSLKELDIESDCTRSQLEPILLQASCLEKLTLCLGQPEKDLSGIQFPFKDLEELLVDADTLTLPSIDNLLTTPTCLNHLKIIGGHDFNFSDTSIERLVNLELTLSYP